MRKTTTFLQGFLSVHFFRHSAGITVLMLFTLSIMSFRFGKIVNFSKKTSTHTTDTSTINSNKTISNLLADPMASEDSVVRSLFKVNHTMESFLKDFKRRETEEFTDMKVWGKPYFDMMDEVLAKNGLPIQLKYLCVIESNLKAGTVSHSGATGPWQLMPDEGRMFGLCMKKGCDERKDYEKSTKVAAGLLKNLYNEFGDWLLVIGAYNCGNGAMRRAIAKAGSRDYWVVEKYLSAQARNHVKKYIATHYIFEGSGGWTTITNFQAAECRVAIAKISTNKADDLTNTTTIEIRGKYSPTVLVSSLMIDAEVFNKLNPGMAEALLQGKAYPLTLPNNKLPLFLANRVQLLQQSLQMFISSAATN